MKVEKYENMIISKRLERILKQLEYVTIFNNENGITPAHGGEDGRKAKDFPHAKG